MTPSHDPHPLQLTEQDLTSSPEWLPLDTPGGQALRLVRLDEEGYRAASFLDQRILQGGQCERATCSFESARAVAARLSRRSYYIFHIGHVGSSLVSRLVGARQEFFSLREPAVLRPLAEFPTEAGGASLQPPALDLNTLLPFLSRTWRPNQRAVIKVTSFVSELAPRILAGADRPAALLMFASPMAYVCNILAGPNSRLETKRLAPMRLRRLVSRLGGGDWRPDPGSEGEHIAMSWLCEMSSLYQAWRGCNTRVLWVDFDAFLREPLSGLQSILRALGATPDLREIEMLATGPLMRQYSKAPEYGYDADLRRRVLESAEHEHPVEIRRAMDWLRRAAARHRLVEDILASVPPPNGQTINKQ